MEHRLGGECDTQVKLTKPAQSSVEDRGLWPLAQQGKTFADELALTFELTTACHWMALSDALAPCAAKAERT